MYLLYSWNSFCYLIFLFYFKALGTANRIRRGDVEEHYLLMQQNRFRSTTILLVLTGILVLSLGILAGLVFYRQYAIDRINTRIRNQSQMQCYIPYDDEIDPNAVTFMNNRLKQQDSGDDDSEENDFEEISKYNYLIALYHYNMN